MILRIQASAQRARISILERAKEICHFNYDNCRKRQKILNQIGFMIAVSPMKAEICRGVRISQNKSDTYDNSDAMHRYDNLILRINRKISGFAHY